MAGSTETICQTQQVSLSSTGGGVTAADQGDFHSGLNDKGATRGEIEHLAGILQPPFLLLQPSVTAFIRKSISFIFLS
jgi:hypothetical protein